MTPNYKDIAEFAKLMVRFEFLDGARIIAWADSIIAELDEPPYWAIELALAGPEAAVDRLDTVEGEFHEGVPVGMFCAYIRRLWLDDRIKMPEFRDIAWELRHRDMLPEPKDGENWGLVLELHYEALADGYRVVPEIRRFINESLAPYAQYEDSLSVALKSLGCACTNDEAEL